MLQLRLLGWSNNNGNNNGGKKPKQKHTPRKQWRPTLQAASASGAPAKCVIHVLSADSDNSLGDTSHYSPTPILQMRTLKLSRLRTGGLLKRPWARKVSCALSGGVAGASGKVPRLWLALPWVGLAWPLGSSFRDALPLFPLTSCFLFLIVPPAYCPLLPSLACSTRICRQEVHFQK